MSKGSKPKQDTSAYKNYLDYLKNYDTSNVDNTLSNLTNWASTSSTSNLPNMGDYTFSADGSDEARQRAEQATYNAYVDKLTPQFEKRRADLETRLANQGLAVGSEAYERAMRDLEEEQNNALNQAAYNSVNQGQQSFSQSLADAINAGNFGNTAQQSYINQLLSALTGSASGYENQQNIFSVGAAKSNVDYQNALAKSKGGIGGALSGALKGGISGAMTGNPYMALGSAALGAYSGYNSNPYA